MKNKKILLIFVFTILISVQELMAKKQLPTPRGNGGFDEKWVIGGSIDNLIPYIIVVGIAFGIWIIQKQFEISKCK
jgi:hypothetical protein